MVWPFEVELCPYYDESAKTKLQLRQISSVIKPDLYQPEHEATASAKAKTAAPA